MIENSVNSVVCLEPDECSICMYSAALSEITEIHVHRGGWIALSS